jgi:hypothetical protein
MDIWEPERCSMPGNNRGARRQRKLIIYQNLAGDSTGMLFFLPQRGYVIKPRVAANAATLGKG